MSLNTIEENLMKNFRDKIKKDFPENVTAVYLFGSRARDDSSPDSDIDLLVIAKENNWEIADQIRRVGYDLDSIIDYRVLHYRYSRGEVFIHEREQLQLC